MKEGSPEINIIGSTSEGAKEDVRGILEEDGMRREIILEVSKGEREKSAEETELVVSVLDRIKEFVIKYGGKPVNCSPENVHFLRDDSVVREMLTQDPGSVDDQGFTPLFGKDAYVVCKTPGNNAENAHAVVHEVLHVNSFQSLTWSENRKGVRRVGFAVRTKNGEFFTGINEAIIEELTLKFLKKYFSELAEEPVIEEFYKKEREVLLEITNEIYEKSPGKFNSDEDVFNVFASSVMTGKLKEVARLIEGARGKGSFRELGKITKDGDKQPKNITK